MSINIATCCIFPPEIICHVLKYSDLRDIVRWRAVSKWFRDITYDAATWKYLYANSCLPRPPGPFPIQSTAYLEQALVRTEKLAKSWTTQPMRIIPRVELQTKQGVNLKLLDGRWLVGCECSRRLVLYDVSAGTSIPQRQVIWKQEKMVEIEYWSMVPITMGDGRFVLYVLFSEMDVELDVPQWKLLEFPLNSESGKLCGTAVFDVPEPPMRLDVDLQGGTSPFLYIWNRNLVFDTRTHTFYELPEFHVALDETRSKIDAEVEFLGEPAFIMLTRTHVIAIRQLLSMVLIQAFTVDGSSARGDKNILRLSHEGASDHLFQSVTILRNSIVDPVTGSTNVRLLDKGADDGQLFMVLNDLTLPGSTGNSVLPIAIVMDKKTARILHRHEFPYSIYHVDCSDAGHLRGIYLKLHGRKPHRGYFDVFSVVKFTVDATQDECTLTLEEFFSPKRIRPQCPVSGIGISFDGARGHLCFVKFIANPVDRDEQVIVVVDIE